MCHRLALGFLLLAGVCEVSTATQQAIPTSPALRQDKLLQRNIGRLSTRTNVSSEAASKPSDPTLEQSVLVGSRLSIPCKLGTPGASLRWIQNGQPVVLEAKGPAKRRQWNVSREGIAALTITHVTRADEGVWACQEIRQDGVVGTAVEVLRLSVTMSPDDPFLEVEGRRLVHQAILTVKEYSPVPVHCVVRGAVPPVREVWWRLGSRNLTAFSELFVEVDPDDDTFTSRSVLSLNLSREVHRQELICQVSHMTWLSSSAVSASINVLYAPSFSITREPGFGHPILAGMSVVLRCEVDANPPPPAPPRWFKQDTSREMTSNDVLNFTAVRPEHAGWYACATDHALGHFTSLAYFLNVRYGADLNHQSEPEVMNSSLDIKLPCNFQGRPKVYAQNKSTQLLAGSSEQLVGNFCADPPSDRVLWVLHHHVLRPGESKDRFTASPLIELDSQNCHRAVLSIHSLEDGDAGEVLLMVRNLHGIGDATFYLNVTGPPVYPLVSSSFVPSGGALLDSHYSSVVEISLLLHLLIEVFR